MLVSVDEAANELDRASQSDLLRRVPRHRADVRRLVAVRAHRANYEGTAQ